MEGGDLNPEEEAREEINKQLQKAGWKDLQEETGDTGYKEEYPTSSGPVDYALILVNEVIAVIEVKEEGKDAYSALTQAKRYAKDINTTRDFGGHSVPFIFTSNSEDVWFQDLREDAPRERRLRSFHRPQGLRKFLDIDYKAAKDFLSDTPVRETDPELWDNQVEAIESIEEALQNNKRRMVIQMATGTGKTRMAAAQLYRLLKADYINSVLFLVDRNNLGDQAEAEFKNYDVGPNLKMGDVYTIEQVENGIFPEKTDIVISTLQSMYSLLENHDEFEIPQDAFDFVISDESHRSIFNEWKVVLSHFDSIKLGLTATPAKQTLSYFNDNWVYSYGYWEAVDDGKVVPYETYRIDTQITMSGLEYEGEEYSPRDLERKISVPDTNRKIAKEFRENSNEDEKTLVFAVNDHHAKELERIFRQVYSDKDDRYVKKITYTTDHPDDWLKRFRNKKYPKIALTVDMISTGVDVKPIENIIFIRPTKSPILYNQMIGRGTRTCDRIGKEKFTIFDCIGIVEYFDETPPFNQYRPKEGGDSGDSGSGGKGRDEEIKIADDVADEVVRSEYIFTTDDGEELRPDDYVTAFENYIDDKKSEIEAIKLIMDSPKELKRKHLKKLNEKLQNQPEGFTEEKLQKAYSQEMTDLIGFVKHALDIEEFPTTEERVEKAFDAWMEEQDEEFTEEEMKWLGWIKQHFMKEKVIKKEDFNRVPFSRHGGWSSAAETFGGEDELKQLLHELNEEVILT